MSTVAYRSGSLRAMAMMLGLASADAAQPRVLVLDDDRTDMLAMRLAGAGYPVLTAPQRIFPPKTYMHNLPHQSVREMSRRVRQMADGTHGADYMCYRFRKSV